MSERAKAPWVPLEAQVAAQSVVQRLAEHRAWVALLLAAAGSAVAAAVERSEASLGAADRALSGAGFGLALPLLAYALCDAALDRGRLSAALRPLARHGANLTLAALGVLTTLCALLGLAGAFVAAVTVFWARGFGDAALARDALSSMWVGALGGVAYAACFTLASSLGKRGGGRKWLLVLDLFVGASSGFLARNRPCTRLTPLAGHRLSVRHPR